MPQRFAQAFEPVEDVDGGEDVGSIGALPAFRFDEPLILEQGQHGLE